MRAPCACLSRSAQQEQGDDVDKTRAVEQSSVRFHGMSLLLAALTTRHAFRRTYQARSLSVLPSSSLNQLSRHAQSLLLICSSLTWIGACSSAGASPSGRSTRAQLIGGAHVHVSERL